MNECLNISVEQYQLWLKEKPYVFLTDPHHHDLENKDGEFYYVDDLYFTLPDPVYPNKVAIGVVLKGTVVNGASIPWLAQCIIPKSGKYNRPAGVHDDGFKRGGTLIVRSCSVVRPGLIKIKEADIQTIFYPDLHKMPQQKIDYLYLKLMEGRNVVKWNRNTQYAFLRLGGWYTWNRYRREDKHGK